MSYLLTALLLFIGYRFVTGFVIPVARTTRQVKRQFTAMRQQMEEAQQGYQHQAQSHSQQQAEPQPKAGAKGKYDIEGEYISFEEVK